MNPDIEQYLKRATRGLWGRKREEVREELSAHIKARITAHRIAGLSEADAIRTSLDELGRPKEVNDGMFKLHTLPTVLGLGSFIAAICAVTVMVVSSTLAQSLDVTGQYPTQGCLEGKTLEPINGLSFPCEGFSFRPELWTNVQALKEVFEPQGVEVTSTLGTLKLSLPEGKTFGFSFYEAPFTDENGEPLPDDYQVDPEYLLLWDVVSAIVSLSDETLIFRGWNNPTLKFGELSFQIGSEKEPVSGDAVYETYLESVFFDSLIPSSVAYSFFGLHSPTNPFGSTFRPLRFDVGAEPGDIYGLVTVLDPLESDVEMDLSGERIAASGAFTLDVAPVANDGSLTLEVVSEAIDFTDALGPYPEVGTGILVRLTGMADKNGLGYEIVPPEQIRLE